MPTRSLEVARHYGDLIDGFVLDRCDESLAGEFRKPVALSDTLMKTAADRRRVAEDALRFARRLAEAARAERQ